jgi:hypothetical protein
MERKMKYLIMGLMLLFTMTAFAQNNNNDVVACIIKNSFFYKPTPEDFKRERAKEVMQDNELERREVGQNENFNTNPLMLNDKTLDYGTFDLQSKGVLTLVKGNLITVNATPIPFYVSIRRKGKILDDKNMLFLNKALYKINLSKIFPLCKEGDLLIINPVNVEHWKAKRILKLIGGGC